MKLFKSKIFVIGFLIFLVIGFAPINEAFADDGNIVQSELQKIEDSSTKVVIKNSDNKNVFKKKKKINNKSNKKKKINNKLNKKKKIDNKLTNKKKKIDNKLNKKKKIDNKLNKKKKIDNKLTNKKKLDNIIKKDENTKDEYVSTAADSETTSNGNSNIFKVGIGLLGQYIVIGAEYIYAYINMKITNYLKYKLLPVPVTWNPHPGPHTKYFHKTKTNTGSGIQMNSPNPGQVTNKPLDLVNELRPTEVNPDNPTPIQPLPESDAPLREDPVPDNTIGLFPYTGTTLFNAPSLVERRNNPDYYAHPKAMEFNNFMEFGAFFLGLERDNNFEWTIEYAHNATQIGRNNNLATVFVLAQALEDYIMPREYLVNIIRVAGIEGWEREYLLDRRNTLEQERHNRIVDTEQDPRYAAPLVEPQIWTNTTRAIIQHAYQYYDELMKKEKNEREAQKKIEKEKQIKEEEEELGDQNIGNLGFKDFEDSGDEDEGSAGGSAAAGDFDNSLLVAVN